METFRDGLVVWAHDDDPAKLLKTACAGFFRNEKKKDRVFVLTSMPYRNYHPVGKEPRKTHGALQLLEVKEDESIPDEERTWENVADSRIIGSIRAGQNCKIMTRTTDKLHAIISSTSGQARIFDELVDGFLYLGLPDRKGFEKLITGAAVVSEDKDLVAVVVGMKRINIHSSNKFIETIVAAPVHVLSEYYPSHFHHSLESIEEYSPVIGHMSKDDRSTIAPTSGWTPGKYPLNVESALKEIGQQLDIFGSIDAPRHEQHRSSK